jgi:hypothetical protein
MRGKLKVDIRDELLRQIARLALKAVREYVLVYMKRHEQRIHTLREQKKGMLRVVAKCSPSTVSKAQPWRTQVARWVNTGVQGVAIHAALVREHQFTGSYASV